MAYLHIVNKDMSDKIVQSTRHSTCMHSLASDNVFFANGGRYAYNATALQACDMQNAATFSGAYRQAYTREAYADGGPCTPTAVNLPHHHPAAGPSRISLHKWPAPFGRTPRTPQRQVAKHHRQCCSWTVHGSTRENTQETCPTMQPRIT